MGWCSFTCSQEASANSSTCHEKLLCFHAHAAHRFLMQFGFFPPSWLKHLQLILKATFFFWKHESFPLFSTYSTWMKVIGLLKELSRSV